MAENEAPQSINQRPIVSFFLFFLFLLFFKKAEQTFFLIPLEAERRLRDKNLLLGPTEVRFIFLSSVTGGSFVDDTDLPKLKSRWDADCGRKDETQLSREHHLFKNIFELSDEMLKMFRN